MITGTLVITTGKTGSSTAKGDVTYTVKAGDEVAFDEDDFRKGLRQQQLHRHASSMWSSAGPTARSTMPVPSIPGTASGMRLPLPVPASAATSSTTATSDYA